MFIILSYLIDKNTPMYGGKRGFVSESQNSILKGDTANTSIWNFPNHLGTHIDFPYHFYDNGQTVEDFDINFWIFGRKNINLLELDRPDNELLIEPKHLKKNKINKDAEIVLLKTGVCEYRNQEKYWRYNPGISLELVDWFRKTYPKLKILGSDIISISSWQYRKIGRIVHKKFLNPDNPIILIEDMDLSQINHETQFKMLTIAPFRVVNENGCPCTIFAEVV